MEHLVVYVSLQPGGPNVHVLADIKGHWQPATVRGRLVAEGWGAELGYPGMIADEADELIEGQLLSSETLHQSWQALDAFEGEQYQRITVDVVLGDGSSVAAQVYTLNGVTT